MAISFKHCFFILIALSVYVRFMFEGVSILHYLATFQYQPYNVNTVRTLETEYQTFLTTEDNSCYIKSNWHTRFSLSNLTVNMEDWSFTATSQCPKLNVDDDEQQTLLRRISVLCSNGTFKFVTSWTNRTRGIATFEFGDPCLGDFIQTCCTDDNPVPNVVHYVWYKDKELDFFEYVSFISVIRFIRPCLILIHGGYIPRGKYWDYIIKRSPNIIHVNRTRPAYIFGLKIKYPANSGDVMRIEALLQYGGIYLDADTILVRSIDALRKYDYTMSRQFGHTYMGSAFIMAKKREKFLEYWYESYRTYQTKYAYNAMVVPSNLAKKYGSLIHVEEYTVARPKGYLGLRVYRENYNWSTLYGLHLYKRLYSRKNFIVPMNETIIRTFNNTVGSMCRYILYGVKEVCAPKSC